MVKKNEVSGGKAGLTRRSVLVTGAAVTGGLAMPFLNTRSAWSKGTPLKFWQFYAPGGEIPAQGQWFDKMITDWNDSHDQKVELEFVPVMEYMGGTKLSTSFASGQGPDIFIVSPGDFLRYYNGDVLLDLTPYIAAEAQADFPESVIANRKVDGKIFGVPMEVEPMAMYYSIKAFEEAGPERERCPHDLDRASRRRRETDHERSLRRLVRHQPGLLPEFHPGIPSCGRAAASSRVPMARAPSILPATIQAAEVVAGCHQYGRCSAPGAGDLAATTPRRISAPVSPPCRMSASGASPKWLQMHLMCPMASSSFQSQKAGNT